MVKSSTTPYCFVSGLADRSTVSTSSKYILTIRQQPQRAKVCGKERDRRPIDPPPIVQIRLADPSSDRNSDYLQSPYLFMCCNLVRADEPEGDIVAPAHRALAGTVVSSLNRLKDIDNSDGGFFVFGDMSARMEGHFRLRFTLFEMVEGQVVHVMSTASDPWTAYSSKTFPGICESTFLSRCFSDQGVRIRIRKDHHVKPKNSSPETAHQSLHSPLSSCYEDHSDDGLSKSRRSKAVPHNSDSYMTKHVAIASRPREGRQSSAEPAPHYYHGHYNHQDSAPSRPNHDPYYHDSHHGHKPSHSSHSYHPYPRHYPQSAENESSPPLGRRPSDTLSRSYPSHASVYMESSHWSSSSSSSSPSMYPPHQGYGPSGSHLNNIHHDDRAMDYSPTPSRHAYDERAPHHTQYQHSRTPSMSSLHSEGTFSPPQPFSPSPTEVPLTLPSISRMPEGKVQLPPIHTLYAH
ncbi:hypothetical protein BG000_000160 [Podila horticola]|nr:hypothetical protein BG000_000160 [Podila horticola]